MREAGEDQTREMPDTIRPGIFCLPLFSPKIRQSIGTEMYFCPLCYVGVKLGISQLEKTTV
jgi:hypothetical protein